LEKACYFWFEFPHWWLYCGPHWKVYDNVPRYLWFRCQYDVPQEESLGFDRLENTAWVWGEEAEDWIVGVVGLLQKKIDEENERKYLEL
jgi:hypothetical protein